MRGEQDSLLPANDPVFLRQWAIMEMMKSWKAGKILPDVFAPDSPETYFARMRKKGEFVDHVFLTFLANLLGHDLILVHVNEHTVANRKFNWIHGNITFIQLESNSITID